MSGLFPQEVIDRVREASDIVEVVGFYLPLKKTGANYSALCPFHSEKTPSFSVSPSRQIYHCFGCGEGGNVISFVMKHENLPFVDALRLLADRAGITLPKRTGDAPEYARLYDINMEAAAFFRQQLAAALPPVRDYVKRRRLLPQTVERFRIGYAPDSWDACLKHLAGKKFTPEETESAGLAKKAASGNRIDRFRNRLMFPIFDEKGRVIAFGGRTLVKDDTGPKYLNSPETPIYSKSRVLYGLNFAAAKIRAQNRVMIVEGYMDLIALHQAGVENAVASSGTAFTEGQCRILKRYTPNFVMIFDGDEAGRKAASRATVVAASQQIRPSVAMLPVGADPDGLINTKGPEAFMEVVKEARPYISYLIDQACGKFNVETPEGRVDVAHAILPELRKMADPVERSSYVEALSQRTSIPAAVIEGQIKATTRRFASEPAGSITTAPPVQKPKKIIPASPTEKMILHHILNDPKRFRAYIPDLKEVIRTPQYVTILDHVSLKTEEGMNDSGELIEKMEDRDLKAAMRLLFMDDSLSSEDPLVMVKDYIGASRDKKERHAKVALKKIAAEENLRKPGK